MNQVLRLPSGKFAPGQSGNPGGRPKTIGHVTELARAYTVEAIKTLMRIATDESAPPAAQVTAATALLDRGWGKPMQALSVERPVPQLEPDELHRAIDQALAGVPIMRRMIERNLGEQQSESHVVDEITA